MSFLGSKPANAVADSKSSSSTNRPSAELGLLFGCELLSKGERGTNAKEKHYTYEDGVHRLILLYAISTRT